MKRKNLIFSLFCFIIFSACSNAQEKQQETLDLTDGIVIDVRTADEQQEGYIPGALLADVTNGDFERMLPTLDEDKKYYLYCRSGKRSGNAMEIMQENGFENVENLGGYNDIKVKVKTNP